MKGIMELQKTDMNGLTLWHDAKVLGRGIAEQVTTLINLHAQRAQLLQIPPVTLCGEGWDAPWEKVHLLDGCTGNSGPSKDARRAGENYTCLSITAPSGKSPWGPHPSTIENVIAHEIAHLRWPTLDHGPEFFRVFGLY